MKDTFYFPHDYNASNDEKVIKLIRLYGYEAYGIYWTIVERLYENGGRISEDYEFLSYKLRAPAENIERVVRSELFFIKDGMIGSKSVDRRLDERRARQEIGRIFAQKRWEKDGKPIGTHRVPYAIKKRKKEGGGAALSGRFPPLNPTGKLINPSWMVCRKCSKKHHPHVDCQTGFMLDSHPDYNS